MLGQSLAERPRAASPQHKFMLSPRAPKPTPGWLRRGVSCYSCGVGAAQSGVINLADPDILRELKTLMTLYNPDLAKQGEGWFTAAWSSSDFEAYKGILAKLPGSATDKKRLVAYQSGSTVVLGMPPVGVVGFPSIWGIEAIGTRLVTLAIMSVELLAQAFPKLTAAGQAAATSVKPTEAGVAAPAAKEFPWLIVAGVAGVALVGAYLLFRK